MMSEQTVNIFLSNGTRVGYFANPVLEMTPEHNYSISGEFHNPEGKAAGKIDFNPEALPYTADISQVSQCGHTKLVRVYVQRGRQPVEMSGVCAHQL